MKINQVLSCFKNKVFPAFLAASTLAIGLTMTACGDKSNSEKPETPQEPQTPPVVVDKDKERTDAIAALNKFMADAKDGKNFTLVSEYVNDTTHTYYADVDKSKIEYNETVAYIVNEEDTLYKVFQAEDLSWHKNEADDGTKDANDTIASFISKVNAMSWSEYDNKTKTLKYELNNDSATATLDTDKITVSVIAADGAELYILKDVGTTTVTLPENIIDDTQQVTPPPELTEEQIIYKTYLIAQDKINKVLHVKSSSQINHLYGIDYENTYDGKHYIYFFIDYTTSYRVMDILKLPVANEITLEKLKSGDIALTQYDPSIVKSIGIQPLNFNDKANQIYYKLQEDNLIQSKNTSIACAYMQTGASFDKDFGTYVEITLYNFTKNEIEIIDLNANADKYETSATEDNLINGTINKTYRKSPYSNGFYFRFSDNAILTVENNLDFQEKVN